MTTAIYSAYTQCFPPKPNFTEDDIPAQTGKVFIVTGGNGGVGFEIVKTLYSKGAKVYMATRSQAKAEEAIKTATAISTPTPGEIKFLHLDLADLAIVREAAKAFAAQENKLDILWNNAAIGVGALPTGSKTKQGHEIHVGTNCLGPFLFTRLLLPLLRAAAATGPKDSVRIVWASSAVVDGMAPTGGINITQLSTPSTDQNHAYTVSKSGNWLLASEFAHRVGSDGIVSLTQNPGNLKTNLLSNLPKVLQIIVSPILYPAKFGSYTNLWAGLSTEIGVEDGGRYGIPWGRWHLNPRKDILDGLKSREEGGTGEAGDFWKWCEERTKEFD